MAQTKEGALKIAASKAEVSVDEYLRQTQAGMKRCTKCKEWKPLADYGTDNSRHDGKDAKCFQCRRVKVQVSRKGQPSAFKGKVHTEETKAILSAQRKGKSYRLGIPHTLETRAKISAVLRVRAARGEKCGAYKDGKCEERRGLRFTAEYKRWRYDVFLRDKFTCQKCGDAKGGNLQAHHIKPFADFPDLRFDVSNGITYCEECHKKEHGTNGRS